ncbi:MAG: M56 family metallopeptidase, partial [Planctomycetota bacterium]
MSGLFLENGFLFNCVWQSTACISAGLLASFILRRRPARAHQLLLLAMLAAVAVPMMSGAVKRFELGMFKGRPPVIQSDVKENLTWEPAGDAAVENTKPDVIPFEEGAAPSVTTLSASRKVALLPVVTMGWCAVSLILLARLTVTFALGIRLLSRSQPLASKKIQQALRIARAKLGIDREVEVRTRHDVHSPVIWCWGSHVVLLVPIAAAEADKRLDWASILCHELAHWKRRDHIAGLLAELTVCVLPWNALMWWAKTQLVRLSERACDDWVLACGQAGEDYAESLLGLVPGGQMAFAPAVVSGENGLAARVRRILQERCPDPRTGVLWALAATILVGFIAAGIAFAQSRPAEDPKLDEPPPITEEDFRNQACKGMVFQNAQRLIAKDKLPLLHKMLEDEAYASCWHNVARLIGYISNNPNSVPVLLHYFKRADDPDFDSIDSLAGKIWTLVFVGQIGGPQADSVLRQALTDEGAAQLAKAWINGQLVQDTPFWDDRNSVITFIRSCAANGLVLSRKQENIDIVRQLYADCRTGKENNQPLEQYLVESLAIHDFITKNGLEAFLSLDISGTAMLKALGPYLQKYRDETSPALTDSEPNRIGPRISF